MDVLFDVCFLAKELRRHAKRVEDCEYSITEKTHDALSRDGLQKVKVKRAGERPNTAAVLYEKNLLRVLRRQMLPTSASHSFLLIRRCSNWSGPPYLIKAQHEDRWSSSRKSNGAEKR